MSAPQESHERGGRRLQFSLWQLGVAVTLFCILLAIPGVALVMLAVSSWLLTALLAMGLLLLLQFPAYMMLRSVRRAQQEAEGQAADTDGSESPAP